MIESVARCLREKGQQAPISGFRERIPDIRDPACRALHGGFRQQGRRQTDMQPTVLLQAAGDLLQKRNPGNGRNSGAFQLRQCHQEILRIFLFTCDLSCQFVQLYVNGIHATVQPGSDQLQIGKGNGDALLHFRAVTRGGSCPQGSCSAPQQRASVARAKPAHRAVLQ